MTDREMLELAALAAGLLPLKDGQELDETMDGGLAFCGNGEYMEWNSLTRGRDTFWLMVTLKLSVICDNDGKKLKVFAGIAPIWTEESRLSDPVKATRRAITRAAADIGKRMREKQA